MGNLLNALPTRALCQFQIFFGLLIFLPIYVFSASGQTPTLPYILEASLNTPQEYSSSLPKLLDTFESLTHKNLSPLTHRKVALKLFTRSGPGLATPRPLVDALIDSLTQRGFSRKNILLVDQSELFLRQSGYLPPLSKKKQSYHGCPVLVLESHQYFHDNWFYDAPLPPLEDMLARRFDPLNINTKSHLPLPLFHEIDFWINLPAATTIPVFGFSGSLVNSSLLAVDNYLRFLQNPRHAAQAVAEINTIPEIKEKFAFSLIALTQVQSAGGFPYDAQYCLAKPKLLLSANPLALDHHLFSLVNHHRTTALNLNPLPTPAYLDFYQDLAPISPKPTFIKVN